MLTNEDLLRVRAIVREIVREEVDTLACALFDDAKLDEYHETCKAQDRAEAHMESIGMVKV